MNAVATQAMHMSLAVACAMWAGEKQEEVTALSQIPLLLTAEPSPQQYHRRTGEP